MRQIPKGSVNYPRLDTAASGSVRSGWKELRHLVEDRCRSGERTVIVGIDGYIGTDWSLLGEMIRSVFGKELAGVDLIDVHGCELAISEQKRVIEACLPDHESVFGRIYRGRIDDFFDRQKIAGLVRRLAAVKKERKNRIVICYGSGSLQKDLVRNYDLTFYFDCPREEVLKRNREWTMKKGQTQSISPRHIYYIDFPVHDRHRQRALRKLDFYVDGTNTKTPKFVPAATLKAVIRELTRMPLRIKPLYEPGVWGGQWLKRNRSLPESMPNCAYGFELIAPEQSLIVQVGTEQIELAFNLLMEVDALGMVGRSTLRKFGREFPIRFAYDDTWQGGNLSVQVHPNSKYMRNTFGERMHQAEMYYVFDAKPGATCHLGVRSGITANAFRRAAEQSVESHKPFDQTNFVNLVPARKGDMLLIPPGTVHGAGSNELILEISSTPYRYTFKIYDYCRPNLDGGLRPIHLEHAFNVIKFNRNENWVQRNLIPEPVLVEEGSANGSHWKRFSLADRREFHHVVHRVEFDRNYRCETDGKFYILNLVDGEVVRIVSHPKASDGTDSERLVRYSETVLIPAGVDAFEIVNESTAPCRVVMSFMRT